MATILPKRAISAASFSWADFIAALIDLSPKAFNNDFLLFSFCFSSRSRSLSAFFCSSSSLISFIASLKAPMAFEELKTFSAVVLTSLVTALAIASYSASEKNISVLIFLKPSASFFESNVSMILATCSAMMTAMSFLTPLLSSLFDSS